jgi:SAM-dependent methyltransferase
MIIDLPRVYEAGPDRPKVGTPEHPMRIATRRAAFESDYWTAAEAAKIAQLFDVLAPVWDSRLGPDEYRPLADALDRGGPFGHRCLEVGAGTGKGTEILVEKFAEVIALDISAGMLANFHDVDAHLVQADGAHLPFADRSIDVIVLVNAFLFPSEVDRVLTAEGALIWVNSLGEDTPIHLPVADVVAALPGDWLACASDAGWGSWAVARRVWTHVGNDEVLWSPLLFSTTPILLGHPFSGGIVRLDDVRDDGANDEGGPTNA